MHKSIGSQIVHWFEQQGRDLPWREGHDPYQIWISEVILQQTRIEQGIKYFYRFIDRIPDVHTLAQASQDEVLKYWEGLGYYSRARNLHAAAKQIVSDYQGIFPTHYTELQKLKGIGPYTSRAIGSFAFDNSTGVIDGNVLRVVARLTGDHAPINQVKTRNHFQKLVDEWVDPVDSRKFNYGMMDLGATVCTPTKPGCMICPLQGPCVAYRDGLTHVLPHKEKKLKRKKRYVNFYLNWNPEGKLEVQQRPEKGLWGGLWEIPNEDIPLDVWQSKQDEKGGQYKMEFKHVFTHIDMFIHVFERENVREISQPAGQFISPEEISNFAFARAVLKIFEAVQVR